MNYAHLANNLAIVTDGFPRHEVRNILDWLSEKDLLTIDGEKVKTTFYDIMETEEVKRPGMR